MEVPVKIVSQLDSDQQPFSRYKIRLFSRFLATKKPFLAISGGGSDEKFYKNTIKHTLSGFNEGSAVVIVKTAPEI